MNPITSRDNEKFKTWKTLQTAKGIKKAGCFILSGENLVREFLRKPTLPVLAELIVQDSRNPLPATLTTDRRHLFALPPELFNELDEMGTHFNLLVLQLPEIPLWQAPAQESVLTAGLGPMQVFCPLGDPQNVGSLIRSCEALQASCVVLTAEAAFPFLPKALKASSGSVLRMPLFKTGPLHELPQDLLTLDDQGDSLHAFQWPATARLLVGEEGQGLQDYYRENFTGQRLRIPIQGVESLNASVSVSIALYDRLSKTP